MTVGTVVWRRRSSWGRTQTDSRISEKTHSHCSRLSARLRSYGKGCWGSTHMYKTPVLFLFKDEHDKGRQYQRPAQGDSTHLPRHLALPRAGEHPLHDAQDVEGRDDIEGLEDDVPCWVVFRAVKQVEVARAEDCSVEDLGDERYALGAAVAVDGEDQDELGEEVGDVSQVAEYLDSASVG